LKTDELKYGILHWLHSQDKTFYAGSITNLPGWWKKCVNVEGDCLEKE
jgi:hypothetical protein